MLQGGGFLGVDHRNIDKAWRRYHLCDVGAINRLSEEQLLGVLVVFWQMNNVFFFFRGINANMCLNFLYGKLCNYRLFRQVVFVKNSFTMCLVLHWPMIRISTCMCSNGSFMN